MKSASDVLHKTPWWALLLMGSVIALGLAAFIVPYHILDYRRDAATPQERQQIKREIDNAFADNAIDIARSVLLSMRGATSDPNRREELNEALRGLEEARRELRDVGRETALARREATREVNAAEKEARRELARVKRDAARALKRAGAGPEAEELRKSFDEAIAAAEKARDEAVAAAKHAQEEAGREADRQLAEAAEQAARRAREVAGAVAPEAERRRLRIQVPGEKAPVIDIEVEPPKAPGPPPAPGEAAAPPPIPELPPEVRTEIRQNVTRDLWRIGVGAGLVLLFIPIFILVVIAKFFIDRSRAAQRMAELKRKEAEFHRMTQQVTEAKLSALQAQVEPHFLYNTLASVQALTEVDPVRANEMTGHLIQYLRNALPKMRESVSTVGQEVELVRAYLNILQMRMGKRLAFDIAVPPELMDRPFPPLMLPSLVENAIKHGLEPQREGGEVRISATEEGDTLRLIVSDTGRGFGETATTGGVGLANIRERLEAMYGAEAKLTLEPREPHGVVATIAVPKRGARTAQATGASTSFGAGVVPPAAAAQPATRTQRTLQVMGTAERAWRKGLTFAFVVLVAITAIVAGLAIFGVTVGVLPVHLGGESMQGGPAKLLGTAGIALGFAVVVIALAIVLAVVYGIGFLMAGLAIFIPIVVLVSLLPALAPFILVGLGVWWFMRRRRRNREEPAPAQAAAPQPETPPVAGAQ